jgi:hypothetical protein
VKTNRLVYVAGGLAAIALIGAIVLLALNKVVPPEVWSCFTGALGVAAGAAGLSVMQSAQTRAARAASEGKGFYAPAKPAGGSNPEAGSVSDKAS